MTIIYEAFVSDDEAGVNGLGNCDNDPMVTKDWRYGGDSTDYAYFKTEEEAIAAVVEKLRERIDIYSALVAKLTEGQGQ
jgi:hypothetical protein